MLRLGLWRVQLGIACVNVKFFSGLGRLEGYMGKNSDWPNQNLFAPTSSQTAAADVVMNSLKEATAFSLLLFLAAEKTMAGK
ncbi:hypothetical protein ACLOJK_027896 [Asimina triloba]